MVGAGARMAELARQADAVTVSSQPLIDLAAAQVDGPVHFPADAVEGERYSPAPAARKDRCALSGSDGSKKLAR